jgi:chemotaxis protein methyltransferase CheR
LREFDAMLTAPEDVEAVASLVHDLCGIYLDDRKSYLIESRLQPLAAKTGCVSYRELAALARSGRSAGLAGEIVDAITTNETSFFRDGAPFEALKHKVVPEIVDRKAGSLFPRRLRLWSAACSTGQEVYSLAMTLAELIPDVNRWDVSILGTDISSRAVQAASAGMYSAAEVDRGLENPRRARFFVPQGDRWKIRDEIRALATFRKVNLLEPFDTGGPYDVIFCRNVAIYFTPEDRRILFQKLCSALAPGGYLFVGGCENLRDLGPQYAPQHHCRTIYYRPNGVDAVGSAAQR